jgi:hypothetical protein
MYVLTSDLSAYAGIDGLDTDLAEIYINTAETIVNEYLGFSPTLSTYTFYLSGSGFDCIILPAHPITELTSITIDGVSLSVNDFILADKFIFSKDGSDAFTSGTNNVVIVCKAGYATIPDIIKLTVLRIATLLATEANGNIGITNKSFNDGSRTFLNYTNFNKYLQVLDNIRIM